MKLIKYILGPIVLASLVVVSLSLGLKWLWPDLQAVSIPTTFSNGSVLTAAQLNSNNTSIYNAFNGHNHDGGDGEPSTLGFTSATATSVGFTGGAVSIGDGTGTSDISTARMLLLNTNTGDPSIRLQCNNTSANAWDISVDNSDSDNLEIAYNGSNQMVLTSSGGLTLSGNSTASAIAWEAYTGTTCGTAPCTTTVDATAAGSGQPLFFGCFVNDGTTAIAAISSTVVQARYDLASDDLEILVTSASFENHTYKCVSFYLP